MALTDFLFGSAPSVKNVTRFGAKDIVGDVQGTLAPFVQQTGQQLGQQVFGQSASFGPGFQGTMGDAFARAQTGNLLNFLNAATNIRNAGTETVVNPGSSGIVGPVLAGLAGGFGIPLGAKLLGLGGGSGMTNILAGATPAQQFDFQTGVGQAGFTPTFARLRQ